MRYSSELINIANWNNESRWRANVINSRSEITSRVCISVCFAGVYLSDRFYIPLTFVRGVRDSRSGGRVLLRFLPVRFESCLNDASRLRNTPGVFQERDREKEGGRERGGLGLDGSRTQKGSRAH